VSTFNSSLAFEEINDPEEDFIDLIPMRHLSVSNASTDAQSHYQVVKVSGNITVSF
jgi:hypothetical protein